MNVSERRLEGLVTVVPAPPTTSKEDRRNRQDRTKSSKRVSARYTRPMPTMPPRTITAAWTLSAPTNDATVTIKAIAASIPANHRPRSLRVYSVVACSVVGAESVSVMPPPDPAVRG